MTSNILVTGGTGYKGSVLIPKLLRHGHHVTALDIQWFGCELLQHPRLTVIKRDVRLISLNELACFDSIIHLASVANDPCGDLNPKLTWEISALATMQLADNARRAGIKQFIYASSGSVYGIKDETHVTEDLPLEPVSEYNKTKMVAERVLLSYREDMAVQIVRPATVSGLSPRMRLDVVVNMLTMQALKYGAITVFGGEQYRPNVHIDDITDLYVFLLQNPNITGIYNAGFENLTINEIAAYVADRTNSKIKVMKSNDPRSYRINSDKLLATGFLPKKKVADAVTEVISAYGNGILKDEDRWYNLRWMQNKNIQELQ
ncbi:SDR family oxidoreductase [bacterium]|nr:SDR family oxidoreductase [bacterium]MDA9950852.1 SDR family oxidoreductase [Luminiphilus sp.]